MPVAQATQTFAGIENENEFYSHHYLAEVFLGNIRAQLDRWNEAEAAEGGPKAPPILLRSLANRWFLHRSEMVKSRDEGERLQKFRQQQQLLLNALGYQVQARELELHAGMAVPVWQVFGEADRAPHLILIPAFDGSALTEEACDDVLSQTLTRGQYEHGEVPTAAGRMGRVRHPW